MQQKIEFHNIWVYTVKVKLNVHKYVLFAQCVGTTEKIKKGEKTVSTIDNMSKELN